MQKIRKYLYPGFLILFLLASVGIFLYKGGRKEDELVLPLQERKGALATAAEWPKTKKQAGELIAKIKTDPKDELSKLQLILIYIQEGRITGNRAYYDLAALRLVNYMLAFNPRQYEALCLKANILLSQHHFQEGLAEAEKAREVNDYAAFVYGLICDANVELGEYEKALAALETMGSIRPDLATYSRQSYLNEIYGNLDRAIMFMDMAVKAGYPGLEEKAWCRVQLGALYEQKADYAKAGEQYALALAERPSYPYALLGQSRVARAANKYAEAISLLEKARTMTDDNSLLEHLADLYELNNEPKKAVQVTKEYIKKLSDEAEQGDDNPEIGHYADKELAYAYIKIGDYKKALKHALIEFNRRPSNIDVNEALAWVHYKSGNYADAANYIKSAIRTGCNNPVLQGRAGLILARSGKKSEGLAMLHKALSHKVYVGPEIEKDAKLFQADLNELSASANTDQ